MVRSAVREVRLGKMLGKAAEVAAPRTTARAGTRRAATGPSGRASEITVWALALLLILFLAIPVGALVIRALGTGTAWDARTYDTLRRALRLSLATTALSMVIVIALGTPLRLPAGAASLPRSRRRRSSCRSPDRATAGGSGLPCSRPWSTGIGWARLAEGGITVGFTTIAVVMAQVFVSAPFYVIAAREGLRSDSDLEAAAADLGATPGQVFRTVTLPLIAPTSSLARSSPGRGPSANSGPPSCLPAVFRE